eukprot:TRINITY_DN4409_c1_g1_i1.p1 TRINITY_DN4409_c1_g1~~TRINITY_DN4409_c1_g1_i1.p1  ORF type:complete len:680 (+),score=197.38 TRINITY_DN4409_c1_g1_i1:155-2041(+)
MHRRAVGAALASLVPVVAGLPHVDRVSNPPYTSKDHVNTPAQRSRRGSTLQALQADCPHGFKVTGASLGQMNGVYNRDESKVVNGRETYWLPSDIKFFYFCSKDGTWKVNWGDWYGDPSKIGPDNCYYVGYVNAAYPTLASPVDLDWYAWTNDTGVMVQRAAQAQCVNVCDITDGSAPAAVYPCVCGNTTCASAQSCTASTDSCSVCHQIQFEGIDAAAPEGWTETVDGLYSRDSCKTVDGHETYWQENGDYYIYYCAEHKSWGISAQHYTSWTAQGNGSCLVKVDGSDDVDSPAGVTQWWAWTNEQWHRLEADWYRAITCPATSYRTATCSPTGAPVTSAPTLSPNAPPAPSAHPTAGPSEAPTAAGGCPPPHAVADVQYSGGPVRPIMVAGGTSPWLPREGAELLWPEGGEGWMKCGVAYRLGSNRRVVNGSSINVTCVADICDVYVFIYHKPPYTGGTNGGLTASLPEDGWTPGSCAAQFKLSDQPARCRHNMVAHRRQIQSQSHAVVTLSDDLDAMYMLVAVVPGSDCGFNPRGGGRDECERIHAGASASSCVWNNDEQTCEDRWCWRSSRSGSKPGSSGGKSPPPPASPGGGGDASCPVPDLSVPEAVQAPPDSNHTDVDPDV